MMKRLTILFLLPFLALASSCARPASCVQERVCPGPCYVPPPDCKPVVEPVAITKPKPHQPQVKHPLNSKPLIIIDPGHGGKDLGAVSPSKPVYHEKNLNLASARLVDGFLRQYGYRTAMTRSDDTFVGLEDRAEFATKQKGELFVSIHFNSAPSATAQGIEVFYYDIGKDKKRSKESQTLAQAVLDKVIKETQASSRGVKHGNYSVIRNSTMPAILIEGGFMTNEKELALLKDPAYMKKLALGIAQGIDAYAQDKGQKK